MNFRKMVENCTQNRIIINRKITITITMLSSKIKISGLLITALMNLKCIDFEMYNCIF